MAGSFKRRGSLSLSPFANCYFVFQFGTCGTRHSVTFKDMANVRLSENRQTRPRNSWRQGLGKAVGAPKGRERGSLQCFSQNRIGTHVLAEAEGHGASDLACA